MRARLLILVAAAAVAILLTACGTADTGVSGESSASLIDDGTLAFVTIDSDLGSDQWQKVDDLLKKFPDRDKLVDYLRSSLEKEQGLDYDRDVKPALGPEVDVAVAMNGGKPAVAVLTQPDDVDKFKALVAKARRSEESNVSDYDETVVKKVGDWYAASDTAASIDAVVAPEGGANLADDAQFKEANAELPDDALAKAYVNIRAFVPLAKGYLRTEGGGGDVPEDLYGLDQVDWFSAAVRAEDEGTRLEGATKGAGVKRLTGGGNFTSVLLPSVPSGVLGFLDFQGGATFDNLKALEAEAGVELRRALGLTFADLAPLFRNEIAFYVRSDAPLPEFSLALETPDEQAAQAAADKLMNALARKLGTEIQTAQEDGLTVKTLRIPDAPLLVHWAVFDGKLLATTSESGIRDFRSSGGKLPSDDSYSAARKGSDVPDANAGVIYVDLQRTIAEIERYATASGEKIPPKVDANLKPLHSLIGYATVDGDVSRFAARLEIK
jgi:major membrane immunogen (membrane-anchored lipoprotein)